MSLSADQKQFLQKLILGAILVAGAIYALVTYVLLPFRESWQELPVQLEELNRKVAVAETVLPRVPEHVEQYNQIVTRIHDLEEQYFIKPVLGSYILEAERILEEHARETGVEIAGIREAGISASLSAVWRRLEYQLRPYSVNVNMRADYHSVVRLIDRIEKSNPFVSVFDLDISESRASPQFHSIRFRIQWPIWADSENVPQLLTEKEMHYEP